MTGAVDLRKEAVDWKKELPKILVPPALAVGYAVWRGGAFLGSAWSWGMLALILVADIAAGFASAYLRGAGRQMAATLVAGAGMVCLFGGVGWLSVRGRAVALTAAERADFVTLEEGGRRRLRHPTLGFSFVDSEGGFQPTGAQPFRSDAHFYAFADRERRIGLTIGMFKGQGDSAASLRMLLESMRNQASALGGAAKVPTTVVDLRATGDDPPRGDMHVTLGDGRHYRLKAYGWRSPEGTPFAILIGALADAPDAATDVLASFSP